MTDKAGGRRAVSFQEHKDTCRADRLQDSSQIPMVRQISRTPPISVRVSLCYIQRDTYISHLKACRQCSRRKFQRAVFPKTAVMLQAPDSNSSERTKKWQNQNQYIYAVSAVRNIRNGADDVMPAAHGTRLKKRLIQPKSHGLARRHGRRQKLPLSSINNLSFSDETRYKTGMSELDRVLERRTCHRLACSARRRPRVPANRRSFYRYAAVLRRIRPWCCTYPVRKASDVR